MDSVSQFVLGAAVGEATLGKKVGNKAAIWGAICGTIPDLDVLLKPFLSELEYLGYHRSFSHSIIFAIIFSPLLAYWIKYLFHKNNDASWREWTLLCFWAIFTHPILDSFTVYGTQLFQPFSNYPVAFNSIFIIDPIYTSPMLLSFIIILFLKRENRYRHYINKFALAFSTLYLAFTVVNKFYVNKQFTKSFQEQHGHYERYFTAPLALSNLYWMSLFEKDDTIYVGSYSIFDTDTDIKFDSIAKNSSYIERYSDTYTYQKMMWFTQGYYTIQPDSTGLVMSDLRFSRSDQFINKKGYYYIFNFELLKDKNDQLYSIKRRSPSITPENNFFPRLWRRIWGDKTVLEN